MKFKYYNDTGRTVNVHPATFSHGCKGSNVPIANGEERLFILPNNTYPWVKMWDHGGNDGLYILISTFKD